MKKYKDPFFVQTPNKNELPRCRYNVGVHCAHGGETYDNAFVFCNRCGWNPPVETKRKERMGITHGEF